MASETPMRPWSGSIQSVLRQIQPANQSDCANAEPSPMTKEINEFLGTLADSTENSKRPRQHNSQDSLDKSSRHPIFAMSQLKEIDETENEEIECVRKKSR